MANHWIITKDHISDAHEPNEEGTMSPAFPISPSRSGRLDHQQEEIERLCPIKFRMYDDDGNLYYEGRMSGYDFDPLDDFGMPNAGCTYLKYLKGGVWHHL